MERIDPAAVIGKGCEFAFGAVVMAGATLGDGVTVGHHSVIYPGVTVGEDTRIQDNSVIGRPTITSGASSRQADEREPLAIGAGCIIGCSVVLYWGSELADAVMVADLASIREGCRIGEGTIVGRGVLMEYDNVIGSRVKIQTGTHITGNMLVEDDVFFGPHVVTMNDLKMDRVAEAGFGGPVIRRGARIGSNATILAGVEIGCDAVVAAGAVVRKDVPEGKIVAGNPGKVRGRVPASQRKYSGGSEIE